MKVMMNLSIKRRTVIKTFIDYSLLTSEARAISSVSHNDLEIQKVNIAPRRKKLQPVIYIQNTADFFWAKKLSWLKKKRKNGNIAQSEHRHSGRRKK
jgi:hypothetical protein